MSASGSVHFFISSVLSRPRLGIHLDVHIDDIVFPIDSGPVGNSVSHKFSWCDTS